MYVSTWKARGGKDENTLCYFLRYKITLRELFLNKFVIDTFSARQYVLFNFSETTRILLNK